MPASKPAVAISSMIIWDHGIYDISLSTNYFKMLVMWEIDESKAILFVVYKCCSVII